MWLIQSSPIKVLLMPIMACKYCMVLFTVPTLLGPAHQISMLGCLEIVNVIGQLLVDVH